MSNSRALRRSVGKPRQFWRCAVCRKEFHSAADRAAHWRTVPGVARMCRDEGAMVGFLGFRYVRGAWRRDSAGARS